ncbi:MAG: glycosyltransferase family 2 protein [Leptolyngbyaceae cyanobacterium SM2_3_12]|nr:glycosyltransferase family 2 protein [Leptolyngbyaceae cyanobacterium SM2_3_12]
MSVVIPAYNASKFIQRTLDSVLGQTYRNLEVLVVDDGSTDNTATIVKQYGALDPRIILLSQGNAGVAAARNLGIAISTGEFIAFIDADDIWYPTNLENQVQALVEADKSVGMVYSWTADIDEGDQLTGTSRTSGYYGNIFPALFDYNIIGNASAVMVRRHCIETVGGYSTELRAQQAQGCEDWDIYLRITAHYRVQLVPKILVGYRQLIDSMSRNEEAMMKSRFLTLQPLEQKFPDLYPRIERWSASTYQVHLARRYSRLGAYPETLHWLVQALRTDCWMFLSFYGNWILFVKTAWKALKGKLFSVVPNIQVPPQNQPSPASPKKTSFRLAKIYFHFMINFLFPTMLYRHWRIKRLVSQMYPRMEEPQMLSFWQTSVAALQVQKLARHADGHLFFQTSSNDNRSEGLKSLPLKTDTQPQELTHG